MGNYILNSWVINGLNAQRVYRQYVYFTERMTGSTLEADLIWMNVHYNSLCVVTAPPH